MLFELKESVQTEATPLKLLPHRLSLSEPISQFLFGTRSTDSLIGLPIYGIEVSDSKGIDSPP
jgi:hypothetical protein